MPETYADVEDRVLIALEDVEHQDKPNVRATARQYGVNYQHLLRRTKDCASKSTRPKSS